MKIRSLLGLGLLFVPLAAWSQTVVSSGYSAGTTVVYNAAGVSTSGTVQITGSANVSFVADTHVTLNPGFKVAVGASFRAKAGPDVDGDGMPNAWEVANGLNPLVADAAADDDGDGLSNQTENQLGTNPHGSSTNTSDATNASSLKIHKPQ